MKYRLFLILLLLISACASEPPKVTNANNSAIAITIGADIHSSILTAEFIKPEKVFFIKLNSTNDSLSQTTGMYSNYSYESYWANLKIDSVDNILMNIESGIYAAVAAFGQGRNSKKNFIVLFPENMVKETIVTVEPNKMVYMGKFILKMAPLMDRMKNADEVQKYYYSTLAVNLHPNCIAYSLEEKKQSKITEISFLKSYQRLLRNTDWEEKINNRLKELEEKN